MIYLDHAATSWPKPPAVLRAIEQYLNDYGGNPGRSGHRISIEAGRVVYEAREALAQLFNVPDPLRIVFTANATEALNLALYGLLKPGDRVVTSGIEHNAMMRPLRDLARRGVELQIVPCNAEGLLDLAALAEALRVKTRLVALNHASNVVGTISPIAQAAKLAHQAGAPLLLDTAQSAGCLPIDMPALGVDLLAFTGHKALCGPPGTGGLVLGTSFDAQELEPIMRGGTGSRSEYEEQPEMLPDKYESGTVNGMGIAGLGAAVRWLLEQGIDNVRAHEVRLTREMLGGLAQIPRLHVYGPRDAEKQTATISVSIQGLYVSDIGFQLDADYAILCRVGLHCAPAAHRTIGTFPEGTVRLALGWSNTLEQVHLVVDALQRISSI
ncbi:MAG: aminotransferase class V-fold PLP-dependent enzyme [Chloroflexi bacterium]|nr:aminotransferase class V-fold PLP-dependent enzyme [Chloroflexota bacterium]